ncbi:MAG: site-specific integrase [Bacteroidales bacterium]|nr:site-specific integrase [Bacteroidales bacterium]
MINKKKRILFDDYLRNRVATLEAEGRYSTASNYRSAGNSLTKYLEKRPVRLDEIDRNLVERYNAALYCRGISRNTVSFYNRVLRAICNRAGSEGFQVAEHPFSGVYTGVSATPKRALPKKVLQRIVAFDAEADRELSLTRDLFLFSFYARGMSFVDMAFLRARNLSGAILTYRRRKTGQALTLRLESCMMSILEKYADLCFGDYLLPIIESEDPVTAHRQYVYRLHRHNLRLKELGQCCGAEYPLNSYAARHSWATLASLARVPVTVISAGLGHRSEQVTRIYLDSLSQGTIDRANKQVIAILLKGRNRC